MNTREPDSLEKLGDKLRNIFAEHPSCFGWFIVAVGALFIIAAITNAKWIFGNARTYNLEKIEGWVNFFGRDMTRLIVGGMGLLAVVTGIIWVWISNK